MPLIWWKAINQLLAATSTLLCLPLAINSRWYDDTSCTAVNPDTVYGSSFNPTVMTQQNYALLRRRHRPELVLKAAPTAGGVEVPAIV